MDREREGEGAGEGEGEGEGEEEGGGEQRRGEETRREEKRRAEKRREEKRQDRKGREAKISEEKRREDTRERERNKITETIWATSSPKGETRRVKKSQPQSFIQSKIIHRHSVLATDNGRKQGLNRKSKVWKDGRKNADV